MFEETGAGGGLAIGLCLGVFVCFFACAGVLDILDYGEHERANKAALVKSCTEDQFEPACSALSQE